jgi:hypothetical protein
MNWEPRTALHITQSRRDPMPDQYKCNKCGHTSSKPGNCCGEPMQKAK